MVELFLQYIQYEKNYSSHTVLSYHKDMEQFRSYVLLQCGEFNVESIDVQLVRSWVLSLLDDGLSAKSINRKLSTLKSFFRFLNLKQIVDKNPAKYVVAPKVRKTLPMFFKEQEMDNALDSLSHDDSYDSVLAHLVIDLLYQTGLRVSELVGLKVSDVDFSNRSITVTGKRNKQRVLPIGEQLLEQLRTYIAMRDALAKPGVVSLFVTPSGVGVYTRFVYNVVHRNMRASSSLSKCSPHVLRHTFATTLLNCGADIDVVKTALGHANLAATEVYTHTTFEQLQTIYKQAHPRAKK